MNEFYELVDNLLQQGDAEQAFKLLSQVSDSSERYAELLEQSRSALSQQYLAQIQQSIIDGNVEAAQMQIEAHRAKLGNTPVLDALAASLVPQPIVIEEPTPQPVVEEPTPEPVVVEPAPQPVIVEPTPEPVVVEPTPQPDTESVAQKEKKKSGTLWIWICLAALLLLGGAAAAYFFMKPADVIEKDEVCVYPAEVVDNVVVDENTKESIDDNAIVPEPDSVKSDDEASAPPVEIAEPAPVKEPVQPAEDTKIYTNVEPTYPGGVMALVNAVRNQVRPQGVVGDVNVEFVVEKDGSVSQVKTLSELSPAANQEAIRVVSGLRMTPATHNGKPVRSKYSLPVQFR